MMTTFEFLIIIQLGLIVVQLGLIVSAIRRLK